MAVCPKQLAAFLVHDNNELRERIYEFLKDDMYRPRYYLSLMEFRELTLQRLLKFVGQKFFSVRDYLRDPRRFMASLECLSFCDYSLAIKSGVHFTLCGGTICKLGTAKHHEAFLPGIDTLALPGCFGMTELGHGSNVMGIETTAVYDAGSQMFEIHTPNNEASKYWIGGSGQHGKVCCVFAQLTVNGRWEGPHVFVVRIRDDAGNLMPGVRIKDHGAKMGLNGVDNGQIWFDHVRVPRDAMLDAFASVDELGNYSSSIPSVSARFGTMVGGLTTGRILIAQGAVDACKIGTTIAIRYAAQRPQFGDKLIMDYLTHQRRLLPGLASAYALHLGMKHLKELAFDQRGNAKAVHVLSSGLKAAATWTRVEVLQMCRECCGGMGFLAENKIGPMKTDMDVDVTFEGDNTVMMQQVARALLEDKAVVDAAVAATTSPARISLTGPRGISSSTLQQLLQLRESLLVAPISGAMAAATRGAANPKEGAAAAGQAFDDNLDLVVELGWAHVERLCLQIFLSEVGRAPSGLQGALATVAWLYGATRVEKRQSSLLAAGVIGAADVAALRQAVNDACKELGGNGAKPVLRLCEGFAIPDHLLQAPIAFDWRSMGC